jgi:hypothetical protein
MQNTYNNNPNNTTNTNNTNNTNNNNTTNNKFVGIASVGMPPKMLLPQIEYIRYRIHDFANRNEKRGEYVETNAIISHGYPWKLRIFPRGKFISIFVRYAGEDDEYINNYSSYNGRCYSNSNSNSSNSNNDENENGSSATNKLAMMMMIENGGGVTARANFVCKTHKKYGEIRKYTHTNDWGFEEFIERDRILNEGSFSNVTVTRGAAISNSGSKSIFLDENGALTIDVELQVCIIGPWMNRNNINGQRTKNVWYPKEDTTTNTMMLQNSGGTNNNGNNNGNNNNNDADETPVGTNHLASLLYTSKEFTDVTFIVQGIEFTAHKSVLAVKCRTLLELVLNDNDNDNEDSDDDSDDSGDSYDDEDEDDESDKKVKAVTTTTKTKTKPTTTKTTTRSRRTRNYNRQDDCYIELNDVKPKVFETLLEYVYGVHTNTNTNNHNHNNDNDNHNHNHSHNINGSGSGNGVKEDEGGDQKIAANDDDGIIMNEHNNNNNNNTNSNINEIYAKELLLAGNRFGCSHLKLYAESIIVEKYICLYNASEYLPLADSHSCALLKEIAMDIISNNPQQAMETPNWYMVEESSRLLTELLLYYNKKQKQQLNNSIITTAITTSSSSQSDSGTNDNDNNTNNQERDYNNYLNNLDVTSLRCRLEEFNLICDGSREMLIKRLLNYELNMKRRSATAAAAAAAAEKNGTSNKDNTPSSSISLTGGTGPTPPPAV